GHLHLDEHVARKELSGRARFLPVLDLDDFLGRNQDLLDDLAHAQIIGPLAKALFHLALEPGVRVHDVPALGHRHLRAAHRPNTRNSRSMPVCNTRSTTKRYAAHTSTNTMTTIVVLRTSFCVGQDVFCSSALTSWKKVVRRFHCSLSHSTFVPRDLTVSAFPCARCVSGRTGRTC